MKVLNISTRDFANMSHNNANALRSVGVSCFDRSIHQHPYGYVTQSEPMSIGWLRQNYMDYDVIQLFHTDEQLYKVIQGHPNLVVYHTGTRYRKYKKRFDEVFKGRKVITNHCEFLLHDPTFNYLAHHTNLKPTKKRTDGKLIIGHYPSQPTIKGTDKIIEMLEPFKDDFDIRISTDLISHEENLKRVSECHIYVELFAPEQDGLPYGCFGMSAYEATALGCLVVTNNINPPAYEDIYGVSPFLTPNTEQEFKNTISALRDVETYYTAKEIKHEGFYEKHGLLETGLRIKRLLDI